MVKSNLFFDWEIEFIQVQVIIFYLFLLLDFNLFYEFFIS